MVGDGLKFKEFKGKGEKEEKNKEEKGKVEEEEDPPAICDVAPTILDIMVRPFVGCCFFAWFLLVCSDGFL